MFVDNDLLLEDFLDGDLKQDMISAFMLHGLVWAADNDRVLLTPAGERYLYEYELYSVDFKKKNSKVLKNYE